MFSFYVDLTSNTTDDDTVANFKNKIQLLEPLYGKWEVALVEISYTKSWKNVRNGFKINLATPKGISAYESIVEYSDFYIPKENFMERAGVLRAGYYESVEQLIDELNIEMRVILKSEDHTKSPEIAIDPITKYVCLKPGSDSKNSYAPNLSDEICGILGISRKTVLHEDTYDEGFVSGDRPADIDAWLHSLYVYCDIIAPQYVGNTRAKLLRAVEVPNTKYGDQVVIKYDNPHYLPLIVNDFEEVEIDIKDDTGESIPFMFGRTRLKLHFRQCQTHT